MISSQAARFLNRCAFSASSSSKKQNGAENECDDEEGATHDALVRVGSKREREADATERSQDDQEEERVSRFAYSAEYLLNRHRSREEQGAQQRSSDAFSSSQRDVGRSIQPEKRSDSVVILDSDDDEVQEVEGSEAPPEPPGCGAAAAAAAARAASAGGGGSGGRGGAGASRPVDLQRKDRPADARIPAGTDKEVLREKERRAAEAVLSDGSEDWDIAAVAMRTVSRSQESYAEDSGDEVMLEEAEAEEEDRRRRRMGAPSADAEIGRAHV